MANALLDALRRFPPKLIFNMAPAAVVRRAREDIDRGRVHRLHWSRDGAELHAALQGARPNIATAFLDDRGEVGVQCDCGPASPDDPRACRHSAALLMTVTALLRGGGPFGGAAPGDDAWRRLGAQLLDAPGGMRKAEPPDDADFRVVLFRDLRGRFEFELAHGGRRFPRPGRHRSPALEAVLPDRLERLFRAESSCGAEEIFEDWLTGYGDELPAAVSIVVPGGEERAARCLPHRPSGGLSLRHEGAADDRAFVSFRHIVRGFDAERLVPLGERLFFLPDRHTLGALEEKSAWRLPNALRDGDVLGIGETGGPAPSARLAFRVDRPLRFSLAEFNALGLAYPAGASERGWAFSPSPPRPATIQRRICIDLPDDDNTPEAAVDVTLECAVHGVAQNWPADLWRRVEGIRAEFPRALFESKRRAAALERGIWNVLAAVEPSEREAAIAETLDLPAVADSPLLRDAERLLSEIASEAHGDGGICLQAGDGLSAPPWFTIAASESSAAELLGTFFQRAAPDAAIDDPAPSNRGLALRLTRARLGAALPDLFDACERAGISLLSGGAPLRQASLRVAVSVERSPERVDWFELKPEVTCDGFRIPHDRWEALITGRLLPAPKRTADDAAPHVSPGPRLIEIKSLERLRALRDALACGRSSRSGSSCGEGDLPSSLAPPRLRVLDWLHLVAAGVDLALPPEDQAIVNGLLGLANGAGAAAADSQPLPSRLNAQLRGYQAAGFRWLAFLYAHRLGAVLADDMGLGKTLQTIAFLAAVTEYIVPGTPRPKLPHLVVVPPSLVFNWRLEIDRFCPGLRVVDYLGRARSAAAARGADVVLATYDVVRRDAARLAKIEFDVAVFDEAQAVKNASAARSRAVRRIDARFKLCLTGTPIENHLGEFHAIVDLAVPGLLGPADAFLAAAADDPDAPLVRRARPFILRRTKKEILTELPPKIETETVLELTRHQKEIYTRAVAEVREEVAAAFRDRTAGQAGIVALTALTRLRQVCVSPGLIDRDWNGPAPKIEFLVSKLRDIVRDGGAALVFSQFTRALDLVESDLARRRVRFLRLDGATPRELRQLRVEKFQSGADANVFLISLRAGGAGLNLTRASHVFHLDPWWNPAVEAQASDRAHRMGQQQTVVVHRLVMRATIEEKMMALKARKQAIYDQILGAGDSTATALHADDMKFLLE